jgi:hypothetical protein
MLKGIMVLCSYDKRGRSPLSFSFPLSHNGFFALDWKKLCERGIKGVNINNQLNENRSFK